MPKSLHNLAHFADFAVSPPRIPVHYETDTAIGALIPLAGKCTSVDLYPRGERRRRTSMKEETTDTREWHTAHFLSSVPPPNNKSACALVILNQPIELEVERFQKIWHEGAPIAQVKS